MSTRVPFQWSNANFAYNTNPFPNQSVNPFTWSDVALIEGLVGAIQTGHLNDIFLSDNILNNTQ